MAKRKALKVILGALVILAAAAGYATLTSEPPRSPPTPPATEISLSWPSIIESPATTTATGSPSESAK